MKRALTICLAAAILTGCSFQMKRYDPMTASQIAVTLDFETFDFERTLEDLEACGASEVALSGIRERHESEMIRLRLWAFAEEAKRVEEEQEIEE